MRAVAEEGATLIQGIHFTNGEEVITIKQANGIVHEVPFDYDAVATPVLIEAMIQEMEIEHSELREATRDYCLNYVKGWNENIAFPEIDGISISDLWNYAESFGEGYKAALE